MPTITAQSIIDDAQLILQDTTAIRWSVAELLGWLNNGQREIAIIKPSAYTKVGVVPLVAGTKQSLPTDGLVFVDYLCHLGVSGTVRGATARLVSRRLMDSQNPGWHSATATAAPLHIVFEPFLPKTFYCYPPSTGGTSAEVMYGASPPDVAAVGNTISLDDVYANALIDYILYRAYSKDSEFVGNAERSLLYRKSFESTMGLKAQSDAAAVAAVNERG